LGYHPKNFNAPPDFTSSMLYDLRDDHQQAKHDFGRGRQQDAFAPTVEKYQKIL
jgi:hypothetical protein